MTREQVEKARKYEQAFRWTKNNFVHLDAGQVNEIAELSQEVFGKEMTRNERNCGTCRLRVMKELANDWFASVAQYQKEDREEEEKAKEEPKKNKGGRPKKMNIG